MRISINNVNPCSVGPTYSYIMCVYNSMHVYEINYSLYKYEVSGGGGLRISVIYIIGTKSNGFKSVNTFFTFLSPTFDPTAHCN